MSGGSCSRPQAGGDASRPSSAYGCAAIGRAEGLLGRCEQSIGHIKQAFAFSPRDPNSGIWYLNLAFAEYSRCRDHAAIEQLKCAVYSGYPTYITYAFLAGAEAAKGNDAEAKLALAEARCLFPQLTIKWILTEIVPPPSIVIDGLRKVGLPEE